MQKLRVIFADAGAAAMLAHKWADAPFEISRYCFVDLLLLYASPKCVPLRRKGTHLVYAREILN